MPWSCPAIGPLPRLHLSRSSAVYGRVLPRVYARRVNTRASLTLTTVLVAHQSVLPTARASQWKEALQDYDRSLAYNPSDAVRLYNRGCGYKHFQRWELAEVDFQASRQPTQPRVCVCAPGVSSVRARVTSSLLTWPPRATENSKFWY